VVQCPHHLVLVANVVGELGMLGKLVFSEAFNSYILAIWVS